MGDARGRHATYLLRGAMPSSARFPISFEPAYAALSRSLFISPDDS